MIYREILPSKKLQNFVLNYWFFDVPDKTDKKSPIQHETLPDSAISIVLIKQPYFNGVRILGPHSEKFQQSIFPGSTYFGIKLLPWINFKPSLFVKKELINKKTDAPDIVLRNFDLDFQKPNNELFSIRSIEEKLLFLMPHFEIEQHEIVKFICIELSMGNSVATVTDKIPFSVRVIQKKFKKVVGLTMKQYSSNARQRKLWIDLLKNQENKLDTILKHNYYDQAHFINEFRNKMNRSHADFENYLKSMKLSLMD